MLDRVDCRADSFARERLLEKSGDPGSRTPIAQSPEHQIDVRAHCNKVAYFPQQVGPTVLIKGDVIYIREPDPCFTQTISDRLRRESRPMLCTAESLLLRGSDQLAISYQCG